MRRWCGTASARRRWRRYRLVGDDFAYLLERVARHHGFIVKTVGDAVTATFRDPVEVVHRRASVHTQV